MKLTKGKIERIFNTKNQSHKKLNNKKIIRKNITCSVKKKILNLHNSTFSTFKKSGAKPPNQLLRKVEQNLLINF
jgi:hypothetical protein